MPRQAWIEAAVWICIFTISEVSLVSFSTCSVVLCEQILIILFVERPDRLCVCTTILNVCLNTNSRQKDRRAKVAPNEIRTEFESSVLSLAVAEAEADGSSRILVGLNSGEVQEWDMGHGGDAARAIRSRDGVIGNLYDSDPVY